MRYHIPIQLSEHLAETREGFLIARDVPIARTGTMEYSPDQVPVQPGDTGPILIERSEEDVFDAEAMASFEGKPVTIDHPDDDVTPATWARLARGHAQNVRRGTGAASGYLLADLVITDAAAIALVRGGLREVSCGYDAGYEQIEPGKGRQRNIRGNHIALVSHGRCGPACRINDHQEDTMTKKQTRFSGRLAALFAKPEIRRVLDEEEEPKPEEQQPATDGDIEERVAALEGRIDEMMILMRQIAPSKDEDEPTGDEEELKPAADEDEPEPGAPAKDKARDKARDKTRDTRTVDADVKARARLLWPGMHVADSDDACAVKRMALRAAAKDADVQRATSAALRGSTLDACDCLTLDAAFVAASEVARIKHNRDSGAGLTKATAKDFGKATTPADINRANEEFYAKRGTK
jgi:hypothetical protein